MNISLSNINWLAVIPLGFASLFFGILGLRRGARFFDHNSDASQKERFRDLFLFGFDTVAAIFCLLIAISPSDLWFVMIPIGLGLFILVLPISILGGFYHLYVVSSFMPKNAGITINALNGKVDEKIPWYEFTPFAFMLGWLMFFLVRIGILSIGVITSNTQELNGLSTIIGMLVGTMTGVLVTLGMFLRSKTG